MADNIEIINDVLNLCKPKEPSTSVRFSCKLESYEKLEICESIIEDIYKTSFHSTEINNNIINNYIQGQSIPECIFTINEKKCKKNVSFNECGKMHFIPNRNEIFEESAKDEIWWNGIDFFNFRNQATRELSEFMRLNPTANYKIYSKTLWLELDFDTIYEYYDKKIL